jgi:hypothetical protein
MRHFTVRDWVSIGVPAFIPNILNTAGLQVCALLIEPKKWSTQTDHYQKKGSGAV